MTMTAAPQLYWLPEIKDWRSRLAAFRALPSPSWQAAIELAKSRLDFLRTNALDAAVFHAFSQPPEELATKPIRLALLGSSTLAHLHAGIRIGALRRGIHLTMYENDYGQYLQELLDPDSSLYRFRPNVVLFAFDATHLAGGIDAAQTAADADAMIEAALRKIEECWGLARRAFGGQILQQTAVPVWPDVLGSNEHRLPGSRGYFIARLNANLRNMADRAGVHLVALDSRIAQDGLAAWYDSALWHRSKQEVSPAAAPFYGDLVARVLAAAQGQSAKCAVLDLDNTLWGGVIGDDGLEGLALGQGSALGEAFVAVQDYVRTLARRGIILAVCSKNDHANAVEPFEKHPEMALRLDDIARFVANWGDKASNIRTIAAALNIGLDALVFVDDNPFERTLVRQELPMVAVPELPEDPALVPRCLADAGYFEGIAVTEEDRERTRQYQGNQARDALKAAATDLPSYLHSLEMQLLWRRFDRIGLSRIVQLINKTNQFNLTTRRYSEDDVLSIMADPAAFGLQLRLIDLLGDNGIIGITIGRKQVDGDVLIDTWLMSCRVLGRQVEAATLNLVSEQARALGAGRLLGEYRPTAKNGMVRDHYSKLGFETVTTAQDGASMNILDLNAFVPIDTFIDTKEG